MTSEQLSAVQTPTASDGVAAPQTAPYRVSIIVPTKNRSRLLAEALQSIRALEGPDLDLEILVCDNGSTDDTAQVAQSFGARLLHATTPGPSATRNVGIQAATGDYLAFLDDDDVYLSGQLRQQLAELAARSELMACVGQVLPTDAEGNQQGPPYPATLPADGNVFEAFLNRWPQIGALVVRSVVRETVGYLDESLLSSEDWDWQLRIAAKHPIGHVAAPVLMFRSRQIATAQEDETNWRRSWVNRRVFWNNVWRGRGRALPWVRLMRTSLRFDGVYAGYFMKSGAEHASSGHHAAARQALGRALAISPLHVAALAARYPGSLTWMARALLGGR